ncbi:hypothetical protein [Variovorax arabinosiphilus]|uniref:hypothetical protein n=1 Tax=Variovorax arabinosiphilus TaxID=3053498 RepID=UPI002576348F|nr:MULTISPECIES: hypothetical protein [unclassified Variovorax]MDM0119022.1 hypothetical protein [Variovorax sp. J2L1-78]MDM0129448.1 hypothetical protein [Variovorax sp. J2L1-63]MDM0232766.1 hypothetical protein [Variovorax sp. J2R1-6]
MSKGAWWVDRAREPSTYQGLSIIAGAIGAWLFKDAAIGEHILQAGLAIAGLIGVGKSEAIAGRDF